MESQTALTLESKRAETIPLSAVQSNVPAFFGALRQEIERTWTMLMFILHEKKGSDPHEAALALPPQFEMPYSRAKRERIRSAIRFTTSALRILLLSMPIPITTVGALSYQKYHLSGEQVSCCPECAVEVEKLASCLSQLEQVCAYLSSDNSEPLALGGASFSRDNLTAVYLPYLFKLFEEICATPMSSEERQALMRRWSALSETAKASEAPHDNAVIPATGEIFL